jgi:hypothetical protein
MQTRRPADLVICDPMPIEGPTCLFAKMGKAKDDQLGEACDIGVSSALQPFRGQAEGPPLGIHFQNREVEDGRKSDPAYKR